MDKRSRFLSGPPPALVLPSLAFSRGRLSSLASEVISFTRKMPYLKVLSLYKITVDGFNQLSQLLASPPTSSADREDLFFPLLSTLSLTGNLNRVLSKIPSWYSLDQMDGNTQLRPICNVKITTWVPMGVPFEDGYINSESLAKLDAVIESGYSLSITTIPRNGEKTDLIALSSKFDRSKA